MLTGRQMEAQDHCIKVCQLKLGDGPTSGHYADLADGQSPCDWWFYWKGTNDQIDCYPVNADDMRDVAYPVLSI